MTEILAPAGDKDSAYAAINAGADAIYLGLTAFSARSSAQNFDGESLAKLINYAHIFGVKIYVALNTLVKDGELEDFIKNAVEAHNAGADALIIQDIYLGAYLKRSYPQLNLHLSTQAGVCNEYGARLAKRLGFSRVILARETPIKDIQKIAAIIETEVFIQGALCTSYSGQCYLSSFAGGNSGNRGKCKQPCRKLYSIDRAGYEPYAYRVSLSDLSVGEDIAALKNAGVTSFKIEGRMRRPEYVAAAVSYYKKLINGCAESSDLAALKRTYNRGNYTKGLAFGQDKSFISSAVQGHIGEYISTVQVVNGRYFCHTQERLSAGDAFKILRDGKEVGGALYDGDAKGGAYLKSAVRLKNGDKVFITTDVSLNKSLLEGKRLLKVKISARINGEGRLEVTLNDEAFISDFTAEKAQGRPFTADDFKASFNKLDKYPFSLEYGAIDCGENVFIPASQLNAFRRYCYLNFYEKSAHKNIDKIEKILPLPAPQSTAKNGKRCAICATLCALRADIGVLKPDDYNKALAPLLTNFNGEKYLYLPPFLTGDELEKITPQIALFDGVYSDGYYAEELCKKLNKKLFAGTGFNIFNYLSLSECKAEYIALSKELSLREAQPLARANTFYLSGGGIKVMDLIYCPFSRSCKSCDMRATYALTDGDGRTFTLRRYKTSECRFEVYNCAALSLSNTFTGILEDKFIYTNSLTKGHGEKPVL